MIGGAPRWSRRRWLLAAGLGPWSFARVAHGRSLAGSAAAQEWRIAGAPGVVRAYCPAGFRARDAGVVLYVHGLYTDVDRAWRAHRLPEQFEASGRNALFIAPAARTAGPDALPWPDLVALLAMVGAALRQPVPPGPLVAAGHSGAYKEIGAWLGHPRLRAILLLDGLYGLEAELRAWLEARAGNRLALVNRDTAAAAATFTRPLAYAVRRARCPDEVDALNARERAAKVLSMGTHTDHLGIITEGKVLPLLLRWAGLPGRA